MAMSTPDEIRAFYAEKLAEYGADDPAGAMAYRSNESHERRLMIAQQLLSPNPTASQMSLLDVGCGLGLLAETWNYSGYYTGVDIVPEFIDLCKARNMRERTSFHELDFLNDEVPGPPSGYDYTVALGTFAWQPGSVAIDMIHKMWGMTRLRMCFTALKDRPLPIIFLTNVWKSLPGAKGYIVSEGYVEGEVMVVVHR